MYWVILHPHSWQLTLSNRAFIWAAFIWAAFVSSTAQVGAQTVVQPSQDGVVLSHSANFFRDNPTEQSFSWTPVMSGQTRYMFAIPREGLYEAQKYNDSSALFYLSSITAVSPGFVQSNAWNFGINIAPNGAEISVMRDVGANVTIGGLGLYQEGFSLAGLLELRYFLKNEALLEIYATAGSSKVNHFNFSLAKLSSDESTEVFSNLDLWQEGGEVRARLGQTWFDFYKDFDISIFSQLQSGQNGIGLDFRVPYETFELDFGLRPAPEGNVSISLGLTANFGGPSVGSGMLRLHSEPLLRRARQLTTMKALRRDELPKIWRSEMGFERNK